MSVELEPPELGFKRMLQGVAHALYRENILSACRSLPVRGVAGPTIEEPPQRPRGLQGERKLHCENSALYTRFYVLCSCV